MADIWLGRFERWLEKYFNAKGGGVIADVSPSMTVELQVKIGNEDRYLQGWNRFTSLPTVAQVAANESGARLRNPAGSNTVAVIELLQVQNAGVTNSTFHVSFGLTGTDLATSGTGVNLDTRGNPNSVCVSSIQATTPSIADLTTTYALLVAQNTGNTLPMIVTENQELVINPGVAFQVVDQTVNETMTVHWVWRERPLESSELN